MGRNFRTLRGLALAAGLAVLACASAAHAGIVHATLTSVTPSRDVHIAFTSSFLSPPSTTSHTIRSGQFQWTGASASNPGPQLGRFVTFCIDFRQQITLATHTLTIEPLSVAPRPHHAGSGNPLGGMGASHGPGTNRTRETLVRQLWAEFFPTLGTDADRSAAFQLALWKIIYETSPTAFTSMTAGSFQVTGASTSAAFVPIANAYLSFLVANPHAAMNMDLAALTSPTLQDQIAVIPEPAALGLLAPVMLTLLRRR